MWPETVSTLTNIHQTSKAVSDEMHRSERVKQMEGVTGVKGILK